MRSKWQMLMDDVKLVILFMWKHAYLFMLIACAIAAFVTWNHLKEEMGCSPKYAVIQSVKSASAGGFLHHDVCVYATDKGDITSANCFLDGGDRIEIAWC
jgi:hypothetical protein